MKLKFWKKEKKVGITKKEIIKKHGQSVYDEIIKDTDPSEFKPTSDDIEKIKENQCRGTAKKTGRRCERTNPLGNCWQHPPKGDE